MNLRNYTFTNFYDMKEIEINNTKIPFNRD